MKGIGKVSRMCPRGVAADGILLFAVGTTRSKFPTFGADPDATRSCGVVDSCFTAAGPKSNGCKGDRRPSSLF